MRAATHTRTWLLAIACLVVFASCRRVTIISFHADSPALVDTLVVNLHGTGKRSVRLDGMDQQLGLYNLPDDSITISAFGCAWNSDSTALYVTAISVLSGHLGSNPYSIVSDAVTVEMTAFTDDSQTPCPMVEPDGSVTGEPSGAGGAAGGGNGGSGAGGVAGAGVGGMTVVGDAGRDGGIDAAGGAGDIDAGAGGNTGEGGCDDGGQHDTGVGAQICPAPLDPPQTSVAPTPTPACVDYCNQIVGTSDGGTALCPDAYESVDQCLRYCTLAAWDTQVPTGDTLGCRTYSLNMAAVFRSQPSARSLYCTSAGPTGGSVNMFCGADADHGGMCATFCNASAKICPGGDLSACLSACESAPGTTEPSCRFLWLQRATSDQRYCMLVDYTGMCVPPGC